MSFMGFSCCPDFVTRETEWGALVSALRHCDSEKRNKMTKVAQGRSHKTCRDPGLDRLLILCYPTDTQNKVRPVVLEVV